MINVRRIKNQLIALRLVPFLREKMDALERRHCPYQNNSNRRLSYSSKQFLRIDACYYPGSISSEWINFINNIGIKAQRIHAVPCENDINPSAEHCRGRILMVSHELSLTGAPLVLMKAVESLCKSGYTVTVLAPWCRKKRRNVLAESFAELGIPVLLDRELVAYRWYGADEPRSYSFPLIEKLIPEYDLLFCNTYATHNIIQEFNGKNIPVLWWLHDGNETISVSPKSFPSKIERNVHIYCVGTYSKKCFQKLNEECEIGSLLYGLEDKAVSYPPISHSKVKFVLCGSIDGRKNQLLLFEALESLSEQVREKIEIDIIGGYEDKKYYRRVVREAEKFSCAKMYGTMPNKNVLQHYQEADCIVLTSIDDPMPVVLTEGMMLSKIILCSNNTGTAELLKDGVSGFVFDCFNSTELRDKIETIVKLMGTPRAEIIGSNGRAIYERYFAIENFEKNLITIIENQIRK